MRIFLGFILLMGGLLLGCAPDEVEIMEPPVSAETDIETTGTIYYVDQLSQPEFAIAAIDMATNKRSIFFDMPEDSWVYEIDVSNENQQLLLSYTPPPDEGTQLYDRIGIFSLPLDQSTDQPQPIIMPTQANEFFYDPIWTPDGNGIVYAHYVVLENNTQTYELTVEHYNVETGSITTLANNGFWPNVSPDGSQVTYLDINFETQNRSLWVVDTSSENARELVATDAFGDLDTPVYSPDGQWIYFVAIPEAEEEASWWDRLTGIRSAEAHGNHNTPGDWYRVPVAGGTPEQVTAESVIMLYGAFAPDENVFGYATVEGLYLLDQAANSYQLHYESRSLRNFTWGE
ncbi:MAG: TolB family protein [Candidatus Promineifilaceae bacterium]